MRKLLTILFLTGMLNGSAQTFQHYASDCDSQWEKLSDVKLSAKAVGALLNVDLGNPISEFRGWGTTFNEQDWKALCMLTRQEQDEILENAFSPAGDLKFSIGRISMNANDYALSWYSCSEVPGDFDNQYFNIEHDKLYIIPYIRAAQKYNPEMRFWMSPWSPPAWMKINHHYAVQSSPYSDMDPRLDYLLYGDEDRSRNEQVNPDKNLFPRRLAVQNYFVQEPRYLQCYADQFCKFIDLYGQQGIPITMVMYQNEAYSYTPYPGCPWISDGILRFNLEYLSPTLKKAHPEVELCLGTFNTNRYDHVKELLMDPRMADQVVGLGFQWEGAQLLERIHAEHPNYRLVSSESECGWGSMDWPSAEHTFGLINHYLGNSCSEYNNWNLILCDQGESAWGWKQNALIKVNSADRTFEYTPEYYAYKHYSHFLTPGAKIIAYQPQADGQCPVLVGQTPENKYVVVAGNFTDTPQDIAVSLSSKCLNCTLPPHSMHTFVQQ